MSEEEDSGLVEGMTEVITTLENNHRTSTPVSEFSELAAKRKAAQARLEELQRTSQEPGARIARPSFVGQPGKL